jgi:hypothetical protein
MYTQETTHYEDFTIKTFTEFADGVVTNHEEYDAKGRKVYSIKDGFSEKWEYSRNRLRRYSNCLGHWKRYTYKGDKVEILNNEWGLINKILRTPDDVETVTFTTSKKRKWVQTTIQF